MLLIPNLKNAALLRGAAFFLCSSPAHAAQISTGSEALAGSETPRETPTVALCSGVSALDCQLLCSGVMISPHVVLTARHCAQAVANDSVRCDKDVFTPVLSKPERIWVTGAARPLANSPQVQGLTWTIPPSLSSCGDDVALLELKGDPTWGKWTAEPSFVDNLTPAEKYVAEGYGPTKSGGGDGNRRRGLQTSLLCSDNRTACKGVGDGETLTASESVMDLTVCSGDSGGPLLNATRGLAYGVLSRAFDSTGSCGLGVYQRLGKHRRLIARTVVAAEAKRQVAAPAWATAVASSSNAPPKALGEIGTPCDGAEDCPGGACVSFDGRLTLQCAPACNAGSCGSGQACKKSDVGEHCAVQPPAADTGCTTAGGTSNEGTTTPWLVGMLALLALARKQSCA